MHFQNIRISFPFTGVLSCNLLISTLTTRKSSKNIVCLGFIPTSSILTIWAEFSVRYLQCRVVQLLDEMVDVDVPWLQAHQQLLALRSGDELHVEGMTGQEGHDGRRQVVRGGLVLVRRRGRRRLGLSRSCHLLQDLLLSHGSTREVSWHRVGPHNARTKWKSLEDKLLLLRHNWEN